MALTHKQETFCQNIASGKEIIESYIPTQCLDSFEEGWNA